MSAMLSRHHSLSPSITVPPSDDSHDSLEKQPERTDSLDLLRLPPYPSSEDDHVIVEKPPTRPQPPPAPNTFPDGGLRAWANVFGCALVSLTAIGQVNAFGVFQTYYAQHQLAAYNASAISWIGGVQIFLLYLSGLVLGRVFDAYGARGLLVSGCVLSTFSLSMLSFSTQYYQIFLSQGVGLGLGIALQFYPILVVPSTWFKLHRAAAIGIVIAGSSLGGILFPLLLAHLFTARGFGFAPAVRVMALVAFGTQFIAICFIKERKVEAPPPPSTSPTSSSVLPPPASASNLDAPLPPLPTSPEQTQKRTWKSLLPSIPPPSLSLSKKLDLPFALHALGAFFTAFGLYTPVWYIQLFSLSQGASPALSFYTIAAMNAAGVVGRIGGGWGADKIGRFNALIPIALIQSISCFAIWSTSHGMPQTIVFAIIFGATSASYSSIASSCVAQLTRDARKIGARTGIFMACMAPGILAGPPVSGAILSWATRLASHTSSSPSSTLTGNTNATTSTNAFIGVQIFTGTVLLLGALCALLARAACVREDARERERERERRGEGRMGRERCDGVRGWCVLVCKV
ncbi:MFS general substrate transporter [Rickenella mellea]|uniref:MFS general substrate transporter n=1 Tax=Rickenella mellea TaxID=50990 RepID=A0A4Y7QGM9_9AGAM|nr:MFS general substrate transporter [Rickenella mellea]